MWSIRAATQAFDLGKALNLDGAPGRIRTRDPLLRRYRLLSVMLQYNLESLMATYS
jgi:hypothetical protein